MTSESRKGKAQNQARLQTPHQSPLYREYYCRPCLCTRIPTEWKEKKFIKVTSICPWKGKDYSIFLSSGQDVVQPVVILFRPLMEPVEAKNVFTHVQQKFTLFSTIYYPGPRGFLLSFIGKFCDANRFLNFFFFYWQEALRALRSALRAANF